jgi:feruloyl esterase
MHAMSFHSRALCLTFLGTAFCVGSSSIDAATAAQSCKALTHLALPDAKITSATLETEAQPYCRVLLDMTPSKDSDIHAEIWLPLNGWNGKYLAVGNGGWGGAIPDDLMRTGLQRGYATSGTDDGHSGPSGSFVLGHPEKYLDFAYRAEHEMTIKSKAVIRAFYGQRPRLSYWDGCSGGGREALIQAHRYPDEFDGIIAGDPANFQRNAWAMWIAQAAFQDPADSIPASKYPMIHQAVLDACDTLDGLKDGLIDDPRRCHFDPKVLQCPAGDATDCLTGRQVQTARTILSVPTTSTGRQVFQRLEPGTELRWARLAGGPEPGALFLDYFKFVVFKDPDWDWRTFNLDRDSALADAAMKGVLDLEPDLSRFARHGGKLLLYQGWADQQVAPEATIEFYESMSRASGNSAHTDDWARLFMAPGMGHCLGGEGPDTFNKLGTLEEWVEQHQSPDRIIAAHSAHGKVDRTRPLCPYPRIARYQGSGDSDDASSFRCESPQTVGTAP